MINDKVEILNSIIKKISTKKFPDKFSNSIYMRQENSYIDRNLFEFKRQFNIFTENKSKYTANQWEKILDEFYNDIFDFMSSVEITEKYASGFVISHRELCSSHIYHNIYAIFHSYLDGEIELSTSKDTIFEFSIPFYIRLCVEKKIKSIIGFRRSINIENGNEFNISMSNIFKFIYKHKHLFTLPVDVMELKSIFSWGSHFAHEARKQYIWRSLCAMDTLSRIFSYESQKEAEARASSDFRQGLSSSDYQTMLDHICNKSPNHLLYINGISIENLENIMNKCEYMNTAYVGNKKCKIKIELSEVNYDSLCSLYNKSTKTFI